jgi:large subunit ribosomal protein L5
MNRLQEKYLKEIVPALQKELGLKNIMAVPKLTKVVVNIGITEDQHQAEALKVMGEQFMVITGQKPKTTMAHKAIAGFKLRAGDPIGLCVTLRGERMYQFVDKLISIVLPRVKDFQGVSTTAFDQQGNYSLGLEEQIVFPEIEYDKIDKVRSLQINLNSTAKDAKVARRLLELLGMPFKKPIKNN